MKIFVNNIIITQFMKQKNKTFIEELHQEIIGGG